MFHPDWDIHAMLRDRLARIEQFYGQAAAPFVERKRLIDAREEPFVDRRDISDDDPSFLTEWQEADENELMIGFVCLALLSKALTDYTQMFVMREVCVGKADELRRLFKGQPKNAVKGFAGCLWWLGNDHPRFSWDQSPIRKSRLEDIVLTRNAFMHNEGFDDHFVQHKTNDFARLSHSMLTNLLYLELYREEGELLQEPQPLTVTRTTLLEAIADVRTFCGYLEGCRTR